MNIKETAQLRLFGFLKIPMLGYVSPSVDEVSDKKCVIKIPLSRKTKNHLGSMYFGTLAVGADCAGGYIAWQLIRKSKSKISLVFKDFHADFRARPESDVYFVCEDGEAISALVEKTIQSAERQNLPLKIRAETRKGETKTVADFVLTLSLKRRG